MDSPPAEYPIPYNGTVIRESARRLKEHRLILYRAHGQDDHGQDYWDKVTLTALGEFLVHWTIAE